MTTETEHRPAVASFQLTCHQAGDQPAVTHQIGRGWRTITNVILARLATWRRMSDFLQRDARSLEVHVDRRTGHPLFSTLSGGLGAHDVDVLGSLGDLRPAPSSDRAALRRIRTQSPDRRVRCRAVPQLADAKHGEQGRVARQDAEIPVTGPGPPPRRPVR